MPRDVRTRWNSTYDMLTFTYNYWDAINTITANREIKVRNYEIEDEWNIVVDTIGFLATKMGNKH
jgi:hypothetical protein